jgi:hypothetical protein
MRWRGPAAIVNDRSILSSERILYKDCDRRCSVVKKISGRKSQGARLQDELIGGKPPVIKLLDNRYVMGGPSRASVMALRSIV